MQRGVLASEGQGVGLEALARDEVVNDRRRVLIVRREHGVDGGVLGEGALELTEGIVWCPRTGGNLIGLELADEGVRALREVGLEDRVVAIGEQGGIVVSVGTVHDQDDGLGHAPG